MNDNGFTLIELLATIVILGIITAMSFPVLRKISEDSMNKKLKTYANSVESSAKLYIDSYSEDLFGRDKSGIVCLTYDELKSKSLIKDISDNDISCNSNKTIVQVTKLGDAYTYDVQLGCTNSKNSDESNLIIFPKNSNLKCETSSTTLKYDLNVSPGKYTDNDKNRSAVTVTLSSDTGINNKYNEIYYSWTLNPNNGNDTWNKLNFDIPSADQQKKDLILNKISEVVVKKQLILPEKTGKWYLKIEVRSLQNAAGDNLLTEKQNKQYGPYTIDRDKPTINGVTISSKDSSYNSKAVNVTINATDHNKFTVDKDLKYCVSENKDSCSSYSTGNVKSYDFSGEYDGQKRILYVWVKDNANNISKSSGTVYSVARTHKIIYHTNGASMIGRSSDTCLVLANGSCRSITMPSITPKSDWSTIGWSTNSDSQSAEYSPNKTYKEIVLNSDLNLYAITRKSISIYFDYNAGTHKNFKSIVLGNGSRPNNNFSKECYFYNGKASSCDVTTPNINLGKNNLGAPGIRSQAISEFFKKIVWRPVGSNREYRIGQVFSTTSSITLKPYLEVKDEYKRSGKVIAYSSNPTNVWIRKSYVLDSGIENDGAGNQKYGVTCNNKEFILTGNYGIVSGEIWFEGYTNHGSLKTKQDEFSADNTCKKRVPSRGNGWSTSVLLVHK